MSESMRINHGSIPTFDGDSDKFQMWWRKFKAFSIFSGFDDAIQEEVDPNLPESFSAKIDLDTEEGLMQKLAKQKNSMAISCFTMAFTREGIMGMVSRAVTEEWPDGLAYLIVKNLMKRYRPIDTISRVEMRQKLNQITMRKDSNPTTLFEKLASIQDQFLAPGSRIDDADLIAVVLDVAPVEYQSVLTAEQSVRKGELTLLDLEVVMCQHYRQMTRKKSAKKFEDDELVLTAFSGACFHCGKQGHRANKCPQRSKGDGNDKQKKKSFKKCLKCGKRGHLAKECWSKNPRKDGQGTTSEVSATAVADIKTDLDEYLLSTIGGEVDNPDLWIADTGATVHMTPYKNKLSNVANQDISDVITMGNGSQEMVRVSGDVIGIVKDKNEEKLVRIKGVAYLENGKFNLFSISQMLRQGWVMQGTSDKIVICKGKMVLEFNIKIQTTKGVLYGIKIFNRNEFCGVVGEATKTKINVMKAHEKLGHIGMQAVKAVSAKLGWELTGNQQVCEACAEGKARQKDIVARVVNFAKSSNKTDGRVYLDISSIQNNEFSELERVRRPYWRIIVDERTQLKFSDFYPTKNGIIEPTCELLNRWIVSGLNIKIIRCDDAGENRALEKRLKSVDWKLNLKFEYTGRDTPQRNHLAEVAFHTIANRGRAILNQANIPRKLRYILWREAFMTATLLDGLVTTTINDRLDTRYVHWEGSNPEFSKHLRTWGEAGAVKLRKRGDTKLDDRGLICMFVGYPASHSKDTYRMWDPKTRSIHVTRDIRWLDRMFFTLPIERSYEVTALPTYFDLNNALFSDRSVVHADDDEQDVTDLDVEVPTDDDTEAIYPVDQRRTKSGRVVSAPRKYDEFITAMLDSDGAVTKHGEFNTMDLHVKNFKTAMLSPDRASWLVAIEDEHNRMLTHNVWTAVDRSTIKPDDRVLTTTWAMKKKPNGRYRARLTARGYEQLEGLHYDANSTAAPVTNDTTIRIMFVLATLAGWRTYVVDVQGAFLNGRFEAGERLFLKVPDGFTTKYDDSTVLKLNWTIYGLKQSAQAFWSELVRALKAMDFTKSKGDPCCYVRHTEDRVIVCLSWVDDCLFLGTNADVIDSKNQLLKYFECDDVGYCTEYVGCNITTKGKSVMITQPVLVQSLVDEFDAVNNNYSTPAPAGKSLQYTENAEEIKKVEIKKYQAGVGKLLYLSRWSRPDISNIVRELARFSCRAQAAHVTAMKRVMDYCWATKDKGLMIKPDGKWSGKVDETEFEIKGVSDSDYAKDLESRRSVTGYSVFLNSAPVAMKSKMQDIVTLSVTEAELIAATQCVQEMMYVKKIVESIGLKVKHPMIIQVDNKGTKDLMNNWSVGGRTRHIDIRYFYIRELKEQNLLKIEWIPSGNNCSDLFTKNLGFDMYQKHANVFCDELG